MDTHRQTSIILMSATKRLHVGGSRRIAPDEADVVCGRNTLARSHPGNRRFRALIQKSGLAYQKSKNRKQKKKITHQVIQAIFSRGGEFLKVCDEPLDEAEPCLEVASEEFIYEKVSHALRSCRPEPLAARTRNAHRPCIDLWKVFTEDQHEVAGEIPHSRLPEPEVSTSSNSNYLFHGVSFGDASVDVGNSISESKTKKDKDGNFLFNLREESCAGRETLDLEANVDQHCHASTLDELDLEPLEAKMRRGEDEDGDGEMSFDTADLLQLLEL